MANELLKGKRGIIFGAMDEQSLAWQVAKKACEQGADIVLTNAPVIKRFGSLDKLAESIGKPVIYADATSIDDLNTLITESQEAMGGKLDFVLHAIGMSVNVRKKKDYTDLNYDWMQKTFDVSAISFHKLMQCLYKADAMNDWGSIVALTLSLIHI